MHFFYFRILGKMSPCDNSLIFSTQVTVDGYIYKPIIGHKNLNFSSSSFFFLHKPLSLHVV